MEEDNQDQDLGPTAKEDVKNSDFLFQTKNASKQKSFSLNLKDLMDLKRNASMNDKMGLFFVNFGEGKEYVVIRKQDFDFLFEEE